jgi:hypothetical protein
VGATVSYYPKYLARAGVSVKIDSATVPVIIKMAALPRIPCEVRMKEAHTFSALVAQAWINDSIAAHRSECGSKSLTGSVGSRIQDVGNAHGMRSQVVQLCPNVEDDLSELRSPARRFSGSLHKPGVMVNRLKQGRLKSAAGIQNTGPPVAETTGPICAYMSERRHQVARPRTGYTALRGNQIDCPDCLH